MEYKEKSQNPQNPQNSWDNLIIGIIGSIIGGIIVYMILKNRIKYQQSQQLQSTQQYQPIMQPQPIMWPQSIIQPQPIIQPIQQSQHTEDKNSSIVNEYKNDEKWKIIRDANDDICEISVIRDAKINARQ